MSQQSLQDKKPPPPDQSAQVGGRRKHGGLGVAAARLSPHRPAGHTEAPRRSGRGPAATPQRPSRPATSPPGPAGQLRREVPQKSVQRGQVRTMCACVCACVKAGCPDNAASKNILSFCQFLQESGGKNWLAGAKGDKCLQELHISSVVL